MPPLDDGGDAELELRVYLDLLKRRWRSIAVTMALLAVLVVGYTARQEKQYVASVDLLVDQRPTESILSTDPNSSLINAQNAPRLLNNAVRAINSGVTRAAVEKAYRGPLDPKNVTAAVGAPESDDVTVKATGSNPQETAKLADLYAETYISLQRKQRVDDLATAGGQIQQQIDDLASRIATARAPLTAVETQLAKDPGNQGLLTRRSDITSQLAPTLTPLENQRSFYQQTLESLRVSAGIAGSGGARILTPAVAPIDPVSPKPVRSGVLALVVGLMLGVGVAFLRDNLDERIRGMDDLTRAAPGVPPLAVVPVGRDGGPRYVAMRDESRSPVAEAFRGLRTSVKFAGLDHPLQVVQVTSALPGEGKTTTVANLAEALAQGGERVAVVCCDLRRPRIHERFNLPLTPGFTDVLLQTAPLSSALRRVTDNLYLLPAGSPPPNPSELLSSDRAASILQILAEEFDVLVVDSTPLLPVTDALVVSRLADATLVVVDVRTTKRKALAQAFERLQQVSAPVTGLVLNGVAPGGPGYGYSYGYGYATGYGESPPASEATKGRPPAAVES